MKQPFHLTFRSSSLALLRSTVYAFLLALQIAQPSFSQQRWEKAYGGRYADVSYSVQQTRDGGYIACGWTNSFGPGTPVRPNVYLVKTDSLGDTLWTRFYGGPYEDGGTSVQQTQDGGYIITGDSDPYGTLYFNVSLIKTDSLGDTLWTKTYLDTTKNLSVGNAVQQTRDTGYIIAGQIGGWDVYLIKTNPSGDTLWTRTYGGPFWNYGRSVRQTQDGGYIVVGERQFLSDSSQVYLIKTNATGDSLWSRTFGGSGYEGGRSVQQTQDGGYIIAGYHVDPVRIRYSFYLLKTDASGDTLWSRLYQPAVSDSDAFCYSVQEVQGGYILVGSTGYQSQHHVYFIRTDANGDTLWTKTYGGTGTNDGLDVQQTGDGGYIIAGCTNSFGSGDDDVYLIKTDSLGNVGVEEFPKSSGAQRLAFNVMPSPMQGECKVAFSLPAPGKALLVVYDALGRKVRVLLEGRTGAGPHALTWDGHDAQGRLLPSGVYFLRLEAGRVNLTRKVVVVR